MKDQLSIKVTITGRVYPLTIERHEEERIRMAAKLVNEKITEYEKNYNVKDREYAMGMISLLFASQNLELQHATQRDDKGTVDRLEKLDKLVSQELGKE